MSENLVHNFVPQEIQALALLADAGCEEFQHEVLNSESSYVGPGADTTIFTIVVPANAVFIMTSLDIEMVPLVTDAAFVGGDFRATDDINPYGSQFAGSGGSGTIVINDNGVGIFKVANAIGVINTPLLFVFEGGHTITVIVNPQHPAAKTLTSSNRITGYLVAESIGGAESVASKLKKNQTQIRTASTIGGATNLINL